MELLGVLEEPEKLAMQRISITTVELLGILSFFFDQKRNVMNA
jgi:hypothetical protein